MGVNIKYSISYKKEKGMALFKNQNVVFLDYAL